jgi:hypothetical protein
MYIKDLPTVIANGGKQFVNLHNILTDLGFEKVHCANKAFLLALIRSAKVNAENLQKV